MMMIMMMMIICAAVNDEKWGLTRSHTMYILGILLVHHDMVYLDVYVFITYDVQHNDGYIYRTISLTNSYGILALSFNDWLLKEYTSF